MPAAEALAAQDQTLSPNDTAKALDDLRIALGNGGNLPKIDALSPRELRALELATEQKVRSLASDGAWSVVLTGRGTLELLPKEQAEQFRIERERAQFVAINGGVKTRELAPMAQQRLDNALILGGVADQTMAREVAAQLGKDPKDAFAFTQFRDGEKELRITQNVRGRDIFLIHSIQPPTDTSLIELCQILHTLYHAGAKSMTLIIPYMGYARQDRKHQFRVSVSMKLAAELIEAARGEMPTQAMILDLHSRQTEMFFESRVDNLSPLPIFAPYLKKKYNLSDLIIAAPDAGSAKRGRDLAIALGNLPLIQLDKRRSGPNQIEEVTVLGNPEGKICVMFDDMSDTGGTLIKGGQALLDKGAKGVVAIATHPLFSGKALDTITKSPLQEVVVTNSVRLRAPRGQKVTVLSNAPLFAEVIRRVVSDESISDLLQSELPLESFGQV
jgi:ribose-phosphate pyrophosphokinase